MKLNDKSQTRLECESTIRCGVERFARTTRRTHQMSRQTLQARPLLCVCACVCVCVCRCVPNASWLVSYRPHDVRCEVVARKFVWISLRWHRVCMRSSYYVFCNADCACDLTATLTVNLNQFLNLIQINASVRVCVFSSTRWNSLVPVLVFRGSHT